MTPHRSDFVLLVLVALAVVALVCVIAGPSMRENAACEARGGLAIKTNRGWACLKVEPATPKDPTDASPTP